MEIFTVGHGARSFEDFVAVLAAAHVDTLVDVRRFPMSRRHPHFTRERLEEALARHGVTYVFAGDGLGGRRKALKESRHNAIRNESFRGYADHMDTPAFRAALDDVEALARAGRRAAVMCAETHWTQCHRRFIADALVVDGFVVTHLLTAGKREAHQPLPEMRVDESGRPVYALLL